MHSARVSLVASRAWNLGLAGFAATALVAVLSVTVADPDLWGHLRFGLDILATGEIVQTDAYSYLTSGQPWINHEWLAEVLFALAWSAAGAAGMIALKTTLALATVGLLYRHLLSTGLHPARAAIAFVLLGLPLLIPYAFFIRPQIFTFLLFAATLLIIRRADRGDYRWLWAAPPLLALWANLHGGVLAGLGMLGLWAAMHLPSHWQQRWRVIGPALACAAILANPYGPDLVTFLLRTATVPRPEIVDWKPLPLASAYGVLYLTVLLTAAAGVALSRQPRRPVPLALCTLTALLPLLAIRHLPLFSIAALVFCAEHVADAWMRVVASQGRPANLAMRSWAPALPAAAAGAVLALAIHREVFSTIRIHDSTDFPVSAVELLVRSGISGNLAVDFGWGEYALWHLAPRIKVGMDGRRETAYPPAIYDQYLDFHYGVRKWDAFLTQHRTDLALVRRNTATDNLLRLDADWILAFEDITSALFVRRSSPLAGPLQQAASVFGAPPVKKHFP